MDRLDEYMGGIATRKKKRSLIPFFLAGSAAMFSLFVWATLQLGRL